MARKCYVCGTDMGPNAKNRKYCDKCKPAAYRKVQYNSMYKDKPERKCGICGKVIERGSGQRKYCKECKDAAYREKISEWYNKNKFNGDTSKLVLNCASPEGCQKCPHPDCINNGAATKEEIEITHSWHNKSEHTFPTVDDIKYKRARCLV